MALLGPAKVSLMLVQPKSVLSLNDSMAISVGGGCGVVRPQNLQVISHCHIHIRAHISEMIQLTELHLSERHFR